MLYLLPLFICWADSLGCLTGAADYRGAKMAKSMLSFMGIL